MPGHKTSLKSTLIKKKKKLKSKPYDKTLEQFTNDSVSIVKIVLFVSCEGKKLHSANAVTFS